jgi:hypothetical protein
MTKDGRTHIAALRDGRELYIYGDRVPNVTLSPGFQEHGRLSRSTVRFPVCACESSLH